MSDALKKLLASIEQLSTKEKALAAHCLLVAMDTKPDENSDAAWLALAESRTKELESGKVQGLSWHDIKKAIVGKNKKPE